jgi:hypothetical protein
VSDDEMSVALLESLQRANPIPPADVANRRDLPSAHALFAETIAQRPGRVRRRTVVVLIALVVLVLAALLGAFALVHQSEPDVGAGPVCYESASLDARSVVTSGGGDLRAACARLWREGFFGTGPVPTQFDVCVLPQGAPAVFPGEAGSVCSGLGLPEAHTTPEADRIGKAEREAGLALGGPDRCIGYDEARGIVSRILEANGLHDWTVGPGPTPRPFNDEYPCASPAVVPDQRTVFIVSVPRAGYEPPPTG